ncbi:MAG: hypothetical protein HY606_06265 [Planctomycetes bacterium]|nr:hypothetical protein [Planctomycetota bacterium]
MNYRLLVFISALIAVFGLLAIKFHKSNETKSTITEGVHIYGKLKQQKEIIQTSDNVVQSTEIDVKQEYKGFPDGNIQLQRDSLDQNSSVHKKKLFRETLFNLFPGSDALIDQIVGFDWARFSKDMEKLSRLDGKERELAFDNVFVKMSELGVDQNLFIKVIGIHLQIERELSLPADSISIFSILGVLQSDKNVTDDQYEAILSYSEKVLISLKENTNFDLYLEKTLADTELLESYNSFLSTLDVTPSEMDIITYKKHFWAKKISGYDVEKIRDITVKSLKLQFNLTAQQEMDIKHHANQFAMQYKDSVTSKDKKLCEINLVRRLINSGILNQDQIEKLKDTDRLIYMWMD